MNRTDASAVERFYRVVSELGVYPNSGNLRFYLRYLFDGVCFPNKRMLDIGAGAGLLGIYGACAGAAHVVCLEPEAEGSDSGVRATFQKLSDRLGLDSVTMHANSLQSHDLSDQQFDVIVLHNSVNHLDEDACSKLHRCADAQGRYQEIFRKLAESASADADLVVADCSRHNLFALIRSKNPFAPTIDWHKHQSPVLWARLLQGAGFRDPRIRWTSYNTLRGFGRWVLGNRFAAYFLLSHFCLTMKRRRRRGGFAPTGL